jgi:N-acetyl-alpha-D-muramate 1-phosphate uridylyltransferase
MKAMIFAAGLGTRLRPLTNTKPKALVEINGVSLLEITIKNLIRYGFNDIVINVHHFSQQVIDFLKSKNNFGIKINISDETDLLLDTGGGLKKAAPLLSGKDPILIHNVDIISDINLRQLYNIHIKNKSLATLACMERNSSRQFLINEKNELCGWRNNKTGEQKISRPNEEYLKPVSFCGIHVISPDLLHMINEEGVFSIIELYLRLAKRYIIYIQDFNENKWIDVGNTDSLAKLITKENL